MNIAKQIAQKLNIADDEGELEPQGPRGVKTQGPQRFRVMTNGQIRRARVRAIESNRRKATRRYRRDWMRNNWRLAVLRGQLSIVMKQAADSPERRKVEKRLVEAYGSVDKAKQHYFEVLEDQRNAAKPVEEADVAVGAKGVRD